MMTFPRYRTLACPFAFTLSLCLAGAPSAQGLLKDINQGPIEDAGSHPRAFEAFNGRVFFSANHYWPAGNGRELYSSDGTSAGTYVFADTCLGGCHGFPDNMTDIGGTLFFTAQTSAAGNELWITDGTLGGTTMVRDINIGISGSSGAHFTEYAGQLFFTARENGAIGTQLWKSDGTSDGTSMVSILNPSVTGAAPRELTVSGGLLFFTAIAGPMDRELWVTDGTAPNTVRLTTTLDFNPPEQLKDLGGKLVFESGGELWCSDGTVVGTVPLGSPNGNLTELTVVGSQAYFVLNDRALWVTDGTLGGASEVMDYGNSSDGPEGLVTAGGLIYFTAKVGIYRQLWVSDGTLPGTTEITAFKFSSELSPDRAVEHGSELFFALWAAGSDGGLWKSDGTPSGTQQVADFNPTGSSLLLELYSDGATLWMSADNGSFGPELWTSDGTGPGTRLVKNIQGGAINASSDPQPFGQLPGKALFLAVSEGTGYEPWVTDGTTEGTIPLGDLRPGVPSSVIHTVAVPFADGIAFSADDTGANSKLWFTNGTVGGTFVNESDGSTPSNLFGFENTLYFRARSAAAGHELWKWNRGTPPVLVRDINPGGLPSSPGHFGAANGKVFFSANDGFHGYELWTTDGTFEGTQLVSDLSPEGHSSPRELTELGNEVYFSARTPLTGHELFASDGVTIRNVEDLMIGEDDSSPRKLIVFDEKLFFNAKYGPACFYATDGTTGSAVNLIVDMEAGVYCVLPDRLLVVDGGKLFATDGTPAGTQLLVDLPLGPLERIDDLTVAGDRAYFSVSTELWTTDGTIPGTQLLIDIDPLDLVDPDHSEGIYSLTAVGNGREIVFAGDDGTGLELWTSDGTALGTTLLADLNGIVAGSFPYSFLRAGGTFVFSAEGETGRELYQIPVADTGGYVHEPFGVSCPSNTTGIAPRMDASGEARLGASLDVNFHEAPPNATGFLFYSTVPTRVILGSCTWYLGAFNFAGGFTGDALGEGAITVDIPNNVGFLGLAYYAQYVITDPGGPLGGVATVTNPIETVVGP